MSSDHAQSANGALPYLATLKRASTYWLREKLFEKGVPVPVDGETRAHLEEHASEDRLRYVDDDGSAEIAHVCYFEFEPNPDFVGAQR